MNRLRSVLKLTFGFTLLYSVSSYAAEAVEPNDIESWNPDYTGQTVDWSEPKQDQYLSLKPSAYLWGYIGKRAVAKGQGMFPFGGDGLESEFFGLVEAAGSYEKKTGYSAGLGFGYRKIFDGSYILGGYAIPAYNRSPYSHNFITVNPGFEALTEVWDFRINGYLPLSGKSWVMNNVSTAANTLVNMREEISLGADAEVGRRLPIKHLDGLKAFIGTYYFRMDQTQHVSGITGRLFYPISQHTSFEIRDSYDKVHNNSLLFGIRFNLGGFDNNEKNSLGLVSRLTDPIEHNFANFASGNTIPVNSQQTN